MKYSITVPIRMLDNELASDLANHISWTIEANYGVAAMPVIDRPSFTPNAKVTVTVERENTDPEVQRRAKRFMEYLATPQW